MCYLAVYLLYLLCRVAYFYIDFIKVFFPNAAGVIDQDYRGNVGVILFNFSNEEFQGNEAKQEGCNNYLGLCGFNLHFVSVGFNCKNNFFDLVF